ncbi:MAG TPA: hypothetical protein VMU13_00920 [Candidatus Paceibacterota bacterium]|nr:hypothetical protein [Candidatus Paceibacterota bacterium]
MMYRLVATSTAFVLSILAITATTPFVFAATGTIISPNQYAWDDNSGYVNWNAATDSSSTVTISDTGITGYIWSAGFGWINLAPTNGGVTNSAGVLGGWAWGTNVGWIDFTGVTIDSSGVFHGHTVAQSTFGTMTFDCSYCEVMSTWHAPYVAPPPSPASGGNGPPPSGPFAFGYQTPVATTTTSAAIPPSLIPKSPPPKTQPKTKPSAHLAPSTYHQPTTNPVQGQPVATTIPAEPTVTTVPITAPPVVSPAPPPIVSPTPTPVSPACTWLTCWWFELLQFFRSNI